MNNITNTINWQHLEELPLNKQHLYNSLDGGGSVANHEGFEVFIYITIVGDYQYRGGYKSHLNLTVQEGGFKSIQEAQRDAEKWLQKKAADAAKRRARRAAKAAGAAK